MIPVKDEPGHLPDPLVGAPAMSLLSDVVDAKTPSVPDI